MEVKITIDGIELSEQEAKELYLKLSDLFQDKREFIYVQYIQPVNPSVPQLLEITCGSPCSIIGLK